MRYQPYMPRLAANGRLSSPAHLLQLSWGLCLSLRATLKWMCQYQLYNMDGANRPGPSSVRLKLAGEEGPPGQEVS